MVQNRCQVVRLKTYQISGGGSRAEEVLVQSGGSAVLLSWQWQVG